MNPKPLFLSLLSAAALLAWPGAAFADSHHGDWHGHNDWHGSHNDWHGNHGDWHGHYYGHRYYGHYPYYYRPYGGFAFYYSSPRYYYDDAPVYYPGTNVIDSDAIERGVQYELRRRGFYHGAIDGDIGPASRAAIRAFQADRGLPITGTINRDLLRSLGLT